MASKKKAAPGRPSVEKSPSTYAEQVGAAIRARRERLHRTGDEAAAAAGLSRQTWYSFERGKIGLNSLPIIAAALGCSVKTLIP